MVVRSLRRRLANSSCCGSSLHLRRRLFWRSYSLSGEPSAEHWRLSIKREPNGAAGTYVEDVLKVGDVIDSSAPRGAFTLGQGEGPVVLLSAGIGLTPVLAMLHALAAGRSRRDVWWIHGARNGAELAFAAEAQALLKSLRHAHSHIRYSAPSAADRARFDFDGPGRLSVRVLQELGAPREADFYLCGPTAFISSLVTDLASRGVPAERLHSENFGAGPAMTPGVVATPPRAPHSARSARRVGTRRCPSREAISACIGIRRFKVCSNSPKPAMCRCALRVAPASATIARPRSSPARSIISSNRSRRRRTAIS